MNLSILLADGSANFQALLEGGEGVFCRVGGHAYADGSVLAVLPTAERPTSATLISTSYEPDGVSVEVRDSGPGFAPANLERVFEAFYTTKPNGVGLGLSISRSMIEAHNGRLWASPNVPRGAIFGFIAPAQPAAGQPAGGR